MSFTITLKMYEPFGVVGTFLCIENSKEGENNSWITEPTNRNSSLSKAQLSSQPPAVLSVGRAGGL